MDDVVLVEQVVWFGVDFLMDYVFVGFCIFFDNDIVYLGFFFFNELYFIIDVVIGYIGFNWDYLEKEVFVVYVQGRNIFFVLVYE